ncbi:acyltransferase [Aldersonia sp. NBC_00410]|uniref:acyltransferase family protein n=1 Tax=Aldersonia sp. NBC_00410 TaxID=2975954 RepID=UPI00225397F4|nr:acyltransferase [Aldersonia sp. NBC_00410]MCX5043049.1 acyltransferase [Aldersonia sp. NBC_00410]
MTVTRTADSEQASALAGPSPRAFVPALEGMRGYAALGVVVTHVAFQTAAASTPVLGRVWSRFDLAVAVFFALSGFLLWRPHAAAARGGAAAPTTGRYLLHRAARILPAYWVAVCAVLLFLPQAGSGFRLWLANLGLVQVFVPLTLTDGLTQMWSLSVEFAFYLLLPVIAFALLGLRGARARWRLPVLLGAAVLSLGWAFLPIPTPNAIHSDNWLPGYFPWFAAGMVLAELVVVEVPRMRRLADRRIVMGLVAIVAFGLATTELAGPEGLVRPEPWQYATKIALGAILGFALLAPLVLGTGRRRSGARGATRQHRILTHPISLALGRWSYGIFIWHLAVLAVVFPTFGIAPFQGRFVFVLIATVLLTLPVAAASYSLVEEPVRRALREWERRRSNRANRGVSGSAATPTATTASNAGS